MSKEQPAVKPLTSQDNRSIKVVFYAKPIACTDMSQVYIGYDFIDHKLVAVRLSKIVHIDQNEVLEHIRVKYPDFSHCNLLPTMRYTILESQRRNIYLITQFCNNGTLFDLFQNLSESGKRLDFCQALHITIDLLYGFLQLMEIGVVHGDIKAKNVFIHNGRAMLGDFNRSVLCQPGAYDENDLANLAKICLKLFEFVEFQTVSEEQFFDNNLKKTLFKLQQGVLVLKGPKHLQQIIQKVRVFKLKPRRSLKVEYSSIIKEALEKIFLQNSRVKEQSVLMVPLSQIHPPSESLYKTCVGMSLSENIPFCHFLLNCVQKVVKQFRDVGQADLKIRGIANQLILKYQARIILVVQNLEMPSSKQAEVLLSVAKSMKVQYQKKAKRNNWTYLTKINDYGVDRHFLALSNITKKLLVFAKGQNKIREDISQGINYLLNTLNCYELMNRIKTSAVMIPSFKHQQFTIQAKKQAQFQKILSQSEIYLKQ